MRSTKSSKPKAGPATQRYLNIREIRDDVVVMKDGSLRAVLLVSSLNFALKSAEEQEAIIQAYMQFLNGLEDPIQIVIQSRKMNIDAYMDQLSSQQKTIEDELLRTQIADYRNFVAELVDLGEIMQKRFYVVVSYDPLRDKKQNFFKRLAAALTPASGIRLQTKEFEKRRATIIKKKDIILSQLNGMGVMGAALDTQSLIELYYSSYNPDMYNTEKLADLHKIRIEN